MKKRLADWGVALLVGLFGLVGPVQTSAATTVTVGKAGNGGGCSFGANEPIDVIESSTSSPSYIVPHYGSITSWSTESDLTLPIVEQLEMWRPASTSGSFTLVGISPVENVPGNAGLVTFQLATPIKVKKGDIVGARFINTSQVACGWGGTSLDTFEFAYDEVTPDRRDTISFPLSLTNFGVNVSATLTY
jgi:hypothetical protein